jgi:hypothetical protein
MTTTRSCPDWPELLELSADLHFKHYTAAEAQLPADVLSTIAGSLSEMELCADLDHNVFNPEHTDEQLAEALRASHWYDLRDWISSGQGSAS